MALYLLIFLSQNASFGMWLMKNWIPDKILRELQNETSMTFGHDGACKLRLPACFWGCWIDIILKKTKRPALWML